MRWNQRVMRFHRQEKNLYPYAFLIIFLILLATKTNKKVLSDYESSNLEEI